VGLDGVLLESCPMGNQNSPKVILGRVVLNIVINI